MLQLAVPVLTGILRALSARKSEISKTSGVAENVVSEVLGAAENYASKDERLQAQIFQELADARAHDMGTFDKTDTAANRLRSSVRPLVTFAAMGWYVFARIEGIELMPEDYAIIGGVLAFWFGFRPFEKVKLNNK